MAQQVDPTPKQPVRITVCIDQLTDENPVAW